MLPASLSYSRRVGGKSPTTPGVYIRREAAALRYKGGRVTASERRRVEAAILRRHRAWRRRAARLRLALGVIEGLGQGAPHGLAR